MLTDPHESGRQINRIAIHNDVLLAAIAPLYYIHSGPETLLVVQTIVLASGALALFFIVKENTKRWQADQKQIVDWLSISVPLSYLLYYPMERTNLYEFHAVTLSTALILWMYLAYLKRKWVVFAALFLGVLLSKEHTGFSLGIFILVEVFWKRARDIWKSSQNRMMISPYLNRPSTQILSLVAIGSFLYVLVSVFFIMPAFRMGGDHFALSYYSKETTGSIGFITKHILQFVSLGTFAYVTTLTWPLLFLPLFSPLILPAVPDFLINVLSSSPEMKTMSFQYTAIITPWLFIATIDTLTRIIPGISRTKAKGVFIVLGIGIMTSSVVHSPLPFSWKNENRLWSEQVPARRDILLWQQILRNEEIVVSATGQFAPYLTNRRVYYDFGKQYEKAEYVLIRRSEIEGHWIRGKLTPYYDKLVKDARYKIIYTNNGVEVYKRISDTQ
jgi:uncharacterized membrane protein